MERLPPEVRPIGWVEGGEERNHHYWICPVRVRDPSKVIKGLFRAGFDPADGGTGLCVVQGGANQAEEMMREVVYMPVDHELSEHKMEKLAAVIRDCGKN